MGQMGLAGSADHVVVGFAVRVVKETFGACCVVVVVGKIVKRGSER